MYAASDEYHQSFVADRGPSVFDVMIDSAGVIAGVLLMFWILQRKKPSPGGAVAEQCEVG